MPGVSGGANSTHEMKVLVALRSQATSCYFTTDAAAGATMVAALAIRRDAPPGQSAGSN